MSRVGVGRPTAHLIPAVSVGVELVHPDLGRVEVVAEEQRAGARIGLEEGHEWMSRTVAAQRRVRGVPAAIRRRPVVVDRVVDVVQAGVGRRRRDLRPCGARTVRMRHADLGVGLRDALLPGDPRRAADSGDRRVVRRRRSEQADRVSARICDLLPAQAVTGQLRHVDGARAALALLSRVLVPGDERNAEDRRQVDVAAVAGRRLVDWTRAADGLVPVGHGGWGGGERG